MRHTGKRLQHPGAAVGTSSKPTHSLQYNVELLKLLFRPLRNVWTRCSCCFRSTCTGSTEPKQQPSTYFHLHEPLHQSSSTQWQGSCSTASSRYPSDQAILSPNHSSSSQAPPVLPRIPSSITFNTSDVPAASTVTAPRAAEAPTAVNEQLSYILPCHGQDANLQLQPACAPLSLEQVWMQLHPAKQQQLSAQQPGCTARTVHSNNSTVATSNGSSGFVRKNSTQFRSIIKAGSCRTAKHLSKSNKTGRVLSVTVNCKRRSTKQQQHISYKQALPVMLRYLKSQQQQQQQSRTVQQQQGQNQATSLQAASAAIKHLLHVTAATASPQAANSIKQQLLSQVSAAAVAAKASGQQFSVAATIEQLLPTLKEAVMRACSSAAATDAAAAVPQEFAVYKVGLTNRSGQQRQQQQLLLLPMSVPNVAGCDSDGSSNSGSSSSSSNTAAALAAAGAILDDTHDGNISTLSKNAAAAAVIKSAPVALAQSSSNSSTTIHGWQQQQQYGAACVHDVLMTNHTGLDRHHHQQQQQLLAAAVVAASSSQLLAAAAVEAALSAAAAEALLLYPASSSSSSRQRLPAVPCVDAAAAVDMDMLLQTELAAAWMQGLHV